MPVTRPRFDGGGGFILSIKVLFLALGTRSREIPSFGDPPRNFVEICNDIRVSQAMLFRASDGLRRELVVKTLRVLNAGREFFDERINPHGLWREILTPK